MKQPLQWINVPVKDEDTDNILEVMRLKRKNAILWRCLLDNMKKMALRASTTAIYEKCKTNFMKLYV